MRSELPDKDARKAMMYTSHELRVQFPSLKTRLPTLWTRSYYIESCGHISEDTVRKYIEEQKKK